MIPPRFANLRFGAKSCLLEMPLRQCLARERYRSDRYARTSMDRELRTYWLLKKKVDMDFEAVGFQR